MITASLLKFLDRMKNYLLSSVIMFFLVSGPGDREPKVIPLPEHPRPDMMREQWINLNGEWNFRFDKENEGEGLSWFSNPGTSDLKILVPFSWGSRLSGVPDSADIAWYSREFSVPPDWRGKKVFLIFGASDWKTRVWLDGIFIGEYQGGYTPFEFDLTSYLKYGERHKLVVKVDDSPLSFKLDGKQGYGEAKGIWQTVYLEARGELFIRNVHFTPDIDRSLVNVRVYLSDMAPPGTEIQFQFLNGSQSGEKIIRKADRKTTEISFPVIVKNMRMWDLDDPFLYDVKVTVLKNKFESDEVSTYFGMRKISTMKLPGTDYTYISLNNKPVYLQLALDQSYHPDGFYTFPSDEFMKNEILNSKKIGLNGNRIHIKAEIPRKLYWADKLGLLIMADVPNSWGEPDSLQKREWETAMEGMIWRDYNHPSIFAWVLFNETWGLFTTVDSAKPVRQYLPSTWEWVEDMYHKARAADPSRLVEDNSACNYDHVITDINSWHAYLPGYKWKEFLDNAVDSTYPGSSWNYTGPFKQGNEPMINSECGNVWGYSGSTGDIDWSWDYHIMMNQMRLHPKVAGWLYTEHHDVINEWNGYYRFDRSHKYTGIEEIFPGMKLNDLHSDIYITADGELCRAVKPMESLSIPVYASFLTGADHGDKLFLKAELSGWDKLGRSGLYSSETYEIAYSRWFTGEIINLPVKMPSEGLALLKMTLLNESGAELHHNFMYFVIEGDANPSGKIRYITFSPSSFSNSDWSQKQWKVLGGLKVNGAGYGYFEYNITIPEDIDLSSIESISLIFEASSKQLFGKDRHDASEMSGDYMRGGGTYDNSRNPNSYPMTDEERYPSAVRVRVNGKATGTYFLEDDPADHRGALSWYSQPRDNKLYEAGSYGYMVKTLVPVSLIDNTRNMNIRLEVDRSLAGGLAIYGAKFGRYPFDPSIVFVMK